METHAAEAEADEGGCINVTSATQNIDGVQAAVSSILGVPAHSVVVCAYPHPYDIQ